MARRLKVRLISGRFDPTAVSFGTAFRYSTPSPHHRQRVPPIGSRTRGFILNSHQLWQKRKGEHTLRPVAQKCLGHPVKLIPFTVDGKQRWKWSVTSIGSVGVSKSTKEARVEALEAVFRWLGSPHNYQAFQRMAELAGHKFA